MKSLLKNSMVKSIITFILLIGSSYLAKANVFTLTVKEELANCIGVGPRTCYQVKYNNSKDWEFFYSEIEGFKYEAGYRYVLKVKRTKRINVPADASAYTYKLVRIVKKTLVTKPVNNTLSYIGKHKWKLIQMNGTNLPNATAYVVFQINKNSLSGNSGCNGMFGSFEVNGNSMTFKNVGGTLMYCEEDNKSKLEGEFLKLISGQTLTYDVADQTLNFYKDGKLVLMFGRAPLDKNNK
jgi:heat shock protein HslJ